MSLEQERRELERDRDALREKIAIKIAEADELDISIESKRDRNPESPERAREIRAEVAKLARELKAANRRVEELLSAKEKVAKRLAKTKRQIKNRSKPQIVDLGLDFNMSMMGNMGNIVGTVGHHTAGPIDDDDNEAEALCRQYHAQHKALGWAGAGYHFCLTREGTIFILRPLKYVGAHTLGYNTGYMGVMCHGTTGDQPTDPQRRAFAYLLDIKGLSGKPVWGHNDLNSTACPGTHKVMYTSKGTRR